MEDQVEELLGKVDGNFKQTKQSIQIMLKNMPTRKKEKTFKRAVDNAENPEELKEAIKNYTS
jgi:hypothetical protein